jgi:CIC family chloride channel protein
VQMGASIGQEIARLTRLSAQDRRSLTASLGGAGLGVAFSAPLGGAVFVFEELTREFRTRLVIAVLAGTATAMAVSHYLVGWDAVFPVPSVETGAMWQLIVYAAFGLVVGLLGVAYNRLVLLLLDVFASIHRLAPEVKAGLVGALVGLLGVAAPLAVGSGEVLNEKVLLGGVPLGALLLLLVVRWFLGPLSYATGTPGGLFAPLLLVGAALGALVAGAANALLPGDPLPVLGLTIVGMSTFFTAVVRAPLTGVVLIVEMTATTSLLVPMMIAAGAAVLSATLVKGPPIYDTLRERLGTQA